MSRPFMSENQLPHSVCKRYGVITALSPVTVGFEHTLKQGAVADAEAEAWPLLAMAEEIEVESDIEVTRLPSSCYVNNCEASLIETEKIDHKLNPDFHMASELLVDWIGRAVPRGHRLGILD